MKKSIVSATLAASLAVSAWAMAQGYGQGGGYGQEQDMQAGGLAPPGTLQEDPEAPPDQTEEDLRRADEEDSGRGLEWFWINGEIGMQHLGLQTFKANNLVDAGVVETTQTGMLLGAGLGLRLVFITLGPRFRIANFSQYQLWTLDAELGLRIPIGSVEPYFSFAGGYASMGSFDSDNIGTDLNSAGVDITGWNARAGFGIDIYFSSAFSLGANLTGELVALTRPGVDASQLSAAGSGSTTGNSAQLASDVYAADGSSMGAGVSLTLVAGLHF